jgi:hypothetical protein
MIEENLFLLFDELLFDEPKILLIHQQILRMFEDETILIF